MPAVPLAVAAALVEFGVPMGISLAATNFVGATALSLALNAGVSALTRTQANAGGLPGASSLSTINAPEVRGSIKQDIPPHRLLLGPMKCGGVVYFYEVIPPYLYIGFIHSLLPITSVEKVFIAQQALTFRAVTDGAIVSPLSISGLPAYNNRLELCVQFGSLSQPVNPLIARDFPSKGANFRLPLMANSVWKFHYGSDFDEFQSLWGNVQIPDAQVVLRGMPLPDPREPTHILDFDPRDPTSLAAAIASWSYNDNAALTQAFWAAMPFGLNAGVDAVYRGAYVDVLKRSADFDDESVALKDGSGVEKRHTIGGVLTFDEKPLSIFESMLTANNGFASPRGGAVKVMSSQPRDPVATIGDADVISGFQYRDRKPKRERLNTPRARYIEPDEDYQEFDAQWPDQATVDALVAADGEVFEQSPLRLGLVLGRYRAQRLLKAYYLNSQLGRTLTVNVGLRFLGVVEGDVVLVSLSDDHYPAPNGLYEVESWSLSEDLTTLNFTLTEYDPSIARNWVPQTDELPLVPA